MISKYVLSTDFSTKPFRLLKQLLLFYKKSFAEGVNIFSVILLQTNYDHRTVVCLTGDTTNNDAGGTINGSNSEFFFKEFTCPFKIVALATKIY